MEGVPRSVPAPPGGEGDDILVVRFLPTRLREAVGGRTTDVGARERDREREPGRSALWD